MRRRAAIAMVCGCILFLATSWLVGCRPTTPRGFGGKGISWMRLEAGKEPLPGVNIGWIGIAVWGDGAAFVIWSDGTGGGMGAGGMGGRKLQPGETRRGVKYEGSVTSRDGRSVNVECHTPDGKTGTVKIGEEAFELTRGGFFLVATSGAKPKVKQLKLDKLDLKPMGSRTHDDITAQTLGALAESDPDIGSFFVEEARRQ